MKKLLLFVVCVICTSYVCGTDSTSTKEIQELILEELVGIRSIQDSTYQQRMNAFQNRGKFNKNEFEYSPSEYSILYGIKNNTDSDFVHDSWNLYGWTTIFISFVALLISIGALFYTWKQYKSQKQTEENTKKSEEHTKNAPKSAQIGTLKDLPRHFYRNLVCTGAIIFRFKSTNKNRSKKSYPSESNLLKLQTLADEIFLPIDIDENSYKKMHELKLLFRNYNTEIKIASEHLSMPHLTNESLEQDFDNLLFKPFYLTERMFEYENLLCSIDIETLTWNAALLIVEEHFEKLKNPSNMAVLMKPTNNNYLKQLLKQAAFYFKCNENNNEGEGIDKKEAIARSSKKFANIEISREDLEKIHVADFVKKISADRKSFYDWFKECYEDLNTQLEGNPKSLKNPYDSLRPYLNYVSQEKTWKFEHLLPYMLAVDIAIEADRIGMINFKL